MSDTRVRLFLPAEMLRRLAVEQQRRAAGGQNNSLGATIRDLLEAALQRAGQAERSES